MLRLEGFCKMKVSVTSLGLEPGTFVPVSRALRGALLTQKHNYISLYHYHYGNVEWLDVCWELTTGTGHSACTVDHRRTNCTHSAAPQWSLSLHMAPGTVCDCW
jgi:hypothetical protein